MQEGNFDCAMSNETGLTVRVRLKRVKETSVSKTEVFETPLLAIAKGFLISAYLPQFKEFLT
jgi:hypothetical protein